MCRVKNSFYFCIAEKLEANQAAHADSRDSDCKEKGGFIQAVRNRKKGT